MGSIQRSPPRASHPASLTIKSGNRIDRDSLRTTTHVRPTKRNHARALTHAAEMFAIQVWCFRRYLLQSVKQKEKRALEEKETGFADQVQRQKLIASLPSTFDTVFLVYQARQRSVLNKQELVDKIIESNPKIVDKGEIEEQLRLLQEFVLEWISEKTGLSGDVLCRVDTALSQSEIRQRLQGVE